MHTLIIIALVILVNQCAGKTCNSNADCPSHQCCSTNGGTGLLHILRATNTETCSARAGVHQQCPLNGMAYMRACGCQTGLICYVGPTGIMPMFGQCITQAEHKQKLEWIKNNPWVQMIP